MMRILRTLRPMLLLLFIPCFTGSMWAVSTPLETDAALYFGPWNVAMLQQQPVIEWGNRINYGSYTVQELYYVNEPYQGHATRVFAYYAIPNSTPKPVPAMVLVHGGDGAAYKQWAAQWANYGYAAIAMDLFGNGPNGEHLPDGGPILAHAPSAVDTVFSGISSTTLTDMWSYHAISATLRAISVVAHLPEVDASRIGIMGISWGGYTTAIVSGLDDRLKMAIIVYGAGYLDVNSYWKDILLDLSTEQHQLWNDNYDPKMYLNQSTIPILWATGTNDYAYPLDTWQRSHQLTRGQRTLRLIPNWAHDYDTPWNTADFVIYANEQLHIPTGLLQVTAQGHSFSEVWAMYSSTTSIREAVLHFTADSGRYQDRTWQSIPAAIDPISHRISATIPSNALVYFLNLTDSHGYTISTEHVSNQQIYLPVLDR